MGADIKKFIGINLIMMLFYRAVFIEDCIDFTFTAFIRWACNSQ
jgi:hypothetical protein